jgi:hypothetical protein
MPYSIRVRGESLFGLSPKEARRKARGLIATGESDVKLFGPDGEETSLEALDRAIEESTFRDRG